jgi:opacity protein-like surface antigen
MKRLLLLGIILFGFTTVYAQRSIEVEGGLGLPGGDLETFYNNQPYYSVTATNKLADNIDGIVQVGIMNYSAENTLLVGGTSFQITSSEEYLPLLFGSRYYFTTGNAMPYVTGKIGYTFWKSKASSSLTSAEESGTSLSYCIGAGLKYTLNGNFYAIGNIDYNVVNSDGNINFTTIRAGIGYTLP